MTLKFYATSSSSTKTGFGGFYIAIPIRLILCVVIFFSVGTLTNVTLPSNIIRGLTIKSSSTLIGNTSTNISTEFNRCTGEKTKELGYSSLIHDMYYAVISVVSVAALFAILIFETVHRFLLSFVVVINHFFKNQDTFLRLLFNNQCN